MFNSVSLHWLVHCNDDRTGRDRHTDTAFYFYTYILRMKVQNQPQLASILQVYPGRLGLFSNLFVVEVFAYIP